MEPLIGPTPNNWTHRRLNDLCLIRGGPSGSDLNAGDHDAAGLAVINTVDISDGRVTDTPKTRINPEAVWRLRRYRLVVGDVLLARLSGRINHVIIGEREAGMLMGGSTIRIQVKETSRTVLLPYYLHCYLMHPAVLEFLGEQVKEGIQPSLTQSSLRSLPIALPPMDVQQEIAVMAQAFREKIEAHEKVAGLARQLYKQVVPQMVANEMMLRA
ncbi:restriction endonuclease subunit S [Salinispora sp. H7-4]|uniref:restriction endonuclease subunit S n=1 Tax=Salinispora sp. H7-4 TaxID=2748321 RepID=UPI0015D2D605|nr:restriction endonuclease subunit S [Salinispora sp. H7-4]NYT94085.1 restriction endonuclease subunit S [Salinispora sp. H7-4]